MEKQVKIVENLKPVSKRVYLIYKCPCGAEHDFTVEEVNLVGRKICYCSRLLMFAPIDDIRVLVRHGKTYSKFNRLDNNSEKKEFDTPTPQRYVVTDSSDTLFDEVVTALLQLGYKPKQAERTAQATLTQGQFSTVEDVIRAVFAKR